MTRSGLAHRAVPGHATARGCYASLPSFRTALKGLTQAVSTGTATALRTSRPTGLASRFPSHAVGPGRGG